MRYRQFKVVPNVNTRWARPHVSAGACTGDGGIRAVGEDTRRIGIARSIVIAAVAFNDVADAWLREKRSPMLWGVSCANRLHHR